MRIPRVRIRTLLVGVAIVATSLGTLRFLSDYPLVDTGDGPHESLLRAGSRVVVYNGEASSLSAGTPCIVVRDQFLGADEDDRRGGHRLITVRISDGPSKGQTIDVPRYAIRAR